MSTFLNQFKLVYRPCWQSNMHSTLDFCPRPARKKTNKALETSVLIYILCLESIHNLSFDMGNMAIRVVEVSNGSYKIRKKNCLRINKGTYWSLRIGLMGRCQILKILEANHFDHFSKLSILFSLGRMSSFADFKSWMDSSMQYALL